MTANNRGRGGIVMRIGLLTTLGAIFVTTAALAQSAPPVQVRGVITSISGEMMTVKSREGQDVSIKVPEKVRVGSYTRATMDDVKPGTYVGATAVKQPDGSMRALEVHLFADNQRGLAEGHTPYDLAPGSTMTNATVEDAVSGVDGRKITMKYKGGEQVITVPPNAPIVRNAPASRADLVAGATVVVTSAKQPDGSLQAVRISVSKNGVLPPT
jgi:hypothetical protein